MRRKTIRFNSEKTAKSFAEKTGGTFLVCHSHEESKFKVRCKFPPSDNYKPVKKNQNQDADDEWSDYAYTADDI